jgi:hypothetical protein
MSLTVNTSKHVCAVVRGSAVTFEFSEGAVGAVSIVKAIEARGTTI